MVGRVGRSVCLSNTKYIKVKSKSGDKTLVTSDIKKKTNILFILKLKCSLAEAYSL